MRERRRLDRIATGHTATDQVETVLYRLVSSPGRRALSGCSPRSGRLIRPLLDVTSDQTRDYCRGRGLEWREDETNLDRGFARNRLRLDVLPHLREIHPAADENVLATVEQLHGGGRACSTRVVDEARSGVAPGGPPAVGRRRAASRAGAGRCAGSCCGAWRSRRPAGRCRCGASQVKEIEALAARGGSAALDLGGGVRVVSEYGCCGSSATSTSAEPEPADAAGARAVAGSATGSSLCELEDGAEAHDELGSPDEPLARCREARRAS